MKRFAFTLQRMLAFKQSMYEKERNTLAQLRAERLTVQMRRDNAEGQMLREDAEFHVQAAKGMAMDEVQAHALYQDSAKRLLASLDEDLARRDAEIERQLQVVVELDKEVKSLEKLRERQWEEYQAEAMREEQERILEIVSNRFAEQQKEGQQAEETGAQAANL